MKNKPKMDKIIKQLVERYYGIDITNFYFDYSFDVIKKTDICCHLNNIVVYYGEYGGLNIRSIIYVPRDIFV